jgi:uncharacterized OB-fold protein
MESKKRVAVGEGLLTGPLEQFEEVRLVGTRCHDCGEVMFGTYHSCANCASEEVEQIPLSREGTLWSYTIINHCPPEPYKGPKNPFIPFGEGLVEVPEGVRVVSILDCPLEDIKIGMKLELEPYVLYENEAGEEVVAWKFKAK